MELPRARNDKMSTGWTGGQYSLFRAGFGIWLAGAVVAIASGASLPNFAIGLTGAVSGLLISTGIADRFAALVLLPLLIWLVASGATSAGVPWLTTPGAAAAGIVLVVMVLLPVAPYGSLAARNRPDPAGGWRFSVGIGEFVQIALAILLLFRAAEVRGTAPGLIAQPLSLLSATLLLIGLAADRLRRLAWLGVLLIEVGFLLWQPALTGHGATFWPLLLAFDPAWIPGTAGLRNTIVYYDGTCGLCHRFVRFLLAEDAEGVLRFAALGSETFFERVAAPARAGLPDSVVVQLDDGRLLVRSAAVLHLAEGLGGIWRGFAMLGRRVPAVFRDAAYDAVARIRLSLFTRPTEACPLVPPSLRTRFQR
ncbi:MAG: DCC1-like thiol-disulfide oxidoreductase family protein [Gemmatimonadota bacterium]